MSTQPSLSTERLIIRELLPEDAPGMFAMDSDPLVHRYVGKTPTQSIGEQEKVIDMVRQQYVENGIGRWAVLEKESGDFVGWTGFKMLKETVNGHSCFYDFGYRQAARFWGKGYATEAGRAALAHGLQLLGTRDIYAMTDVDNGASRRVLEKLGFRLVEIFNYDGPLNWRYDDQPTTWYKLRNKE